MVVNLPWVDPWCFYTAFISAAFCLYKTFFWWSVFVYKIHRCQSPTVWCSRPQEWAQALSLLYSDDTIPFRLDPFALPGCKDERWSDMALFLIEIWFYFSLVVSNILDFHPYLGIQDPIWRSHIFQLGWFNQPPTSYGSLFSSHKSLRKPKGIP